MKINIAKSAGFCFGVKRAVDTVYKESSKKNVYTFGPIIHNDEVVADLERQGVHVINDSEDFKSLSEGTIIIRSHGVSKAIYVKIFDWLQHLVAGKGVEEYDEANKDMYKSFCQKNKPDGEIIFLAADPDCKIKGVGTALLSAFEKDESGKLIYLYTDNACTYQFYEHRGFERSEERQVVLDLDKRQVPLTCLFYTKKITEQ